ncbi:MAG: hypothetical protein R6U78_13185 [Bacteroidales bacterium]
MRWLAQVMRNLVSNAVKFTDKGHIKIGYRWRDKEKVLLFVGDPGGIPEREGTPVPGRAPGNE